MNRNIETYLKEVLQYIENAKVREKVEQELRYHLLETREYWIENGFSKQEAEEKAVEQMGNPITVGNEMEKVHKSRINQFYIPILIHVMICLVSLILSTFNNATGEIMMNTPITSAVYLVETVFLIGLYFYFGKKFLTTISKKTLRNTCLLFFAFKLLLIIVGFSLMSIGTGVMAENSQVPFILLVYFNLNWLFINFAIPTPAMISYLLISIGSPLLLYISGMYAIRYRYKKAHLK